MTKEEALTKLKELSNQLEHVEYCDIVDIIKTSIRFIPIPNTILRQHSRIDRVRKNINENLFTKVDELSYIKNPEIIKNMKEFGRANMPFQSMFYGAIESSELKQQRVVAIAETSELFQNPEGVHLDGELYTVSRWTNKKDLLLAQVIFSNEAIKINPDVKKAFEHQKEIARQSLKVEDFDYFIDFLVFISDQFARPKNTHHDYKISTAYTNIVLEHPEINGIVFPSVQTKLMGLNIVLEPKIVEEYLDINVIATQKLYKNRMQTFIGKHRNCLNPKDCYDNLIWSELDTDDASKEHIDKYLQE